jgi:hypothetical protein
MNVNLSTVLGTAAVSITLGLSSTPHIALPLWVALTWSIFISASIGLTIIFACIILKTIAHATATTMKQSNP